MTLSSQLCKHSSRVYVVFCGCCVHVCFSQCHSCGTMFTPLVQRHLEISLKAETDLSSCLDWRRYHGVSSITADGL